MIKINLLPQKRAKRGAQQVTRGPTDNAGMQVGLGVGALVALGLIVFFAMDFRVRGQKDDFEQKTKQLGNAINEKTNSLMGYDQLKLQKEEIKKKIASIDQLDKNKVVPANVLHEIGHIMSPRGPTMTKKRQTEIRNSSKQYDESWNSSHVWLTSFSDTNGVFKLEGGARTRDDITQLSKRLDASMYFIDVKLTSGEPVTDKDSNLSYYKFLISGKVAY
jgi:Tfp pilus assembly protein PilN